MHFRHPWCSTMSIYDHCWLSSFFSRETWCLQSLKWAAFWLLFEGTLISACSTTGASGSISFSGQYWYWLVYTTAVCGLCWRAVIICKFQLICDSWHQCAPFVDNLNENFRSILFFMTMTWRNFQSYLKKQEWIDFQSFRLHIDNSALHLQFFS